MSATSKPEGKTIFRYGWKLSSKAKTLRFQPRAMLGAQETLSRVEMNAPLRGALDTVSRAGAPVCLDNGHCRHTRNDPRLECGCEPVSGLHKSFHKALEAGFVAFSRNWTTLQVP